MVCAKLGVGGWDTGGNGSWSREWGGLRLGSEVEGRRGDFLWSDVQRAFYLSTEDSSLREGSKCKRGT